MTADGTDAIGNSGIFLGPEGNATYEISRNTFTHTSGRQGTAIAVTNGLSTHTTATTSSGKIVGNTIGTDGVSNSGFAGLIDVTYAAEQHTATVLISGNKIYNPNGGGGSVTVQAGDGTGDNRQTVVNATVIGNLIKDPTDNLFTGSYNRAFNGATLNLKLGGSGAERNDFSNGITAVSEANGQFDVELETGPSNNGYGSSTINLTKGASTATGTGAAAMPQVVKDNNLNPNTTSVETYAYGVGNYNVVTTTPAQPQTAASGGVQAEAATPGETHLTQQQLDGIVSAAIDHWDAAGATESQIAALKAVTVSVADLAGDAVGQHSPGQILLDVDAAGHGWFIDPTPGDSFEFAHAASATDLYAHPTSAAAGHLDLLTVVAHEMGHVLGLDDLTAAADAHGLMYDSLVDGERRLPGAADVKFASASITAAGTASGSGTAGTGDGAAARTVDPSKAIDPSKTADPIKTGDAAKVADPIKSGDAAKAAEPNKASDASKTADPIKAGDAAKAADPIKTGDPSKAIDPGNTADPSKAGDAAKTADPIKLDKGGPVPASTDAGHAEPSKDSFVFTAPKGETGPAAGSGGASTAAQQPVGGATDPMLKQDHWADVSHVDGTHAADPVPVVAQADPHAATSWHP